MKYVLYSKKCYILVMMALSVGASPGPFYLPGKAPGHGWACRAADLIEKTINSIISARPPGPTGIVSESGDPST